MNSRLIRILLVVIGMAIGLSASYVLKNIDTDINAQRSSADMPARAGGVPLGSHRGCARRPGGVRRSRPERGVLDVAHREPAAGASEARRGFRRVPHGAGRARRLRAGGGRARKFPRRSTPKVREFVQSGSSLLAADMIFSDGLESMATASAQVGSGAQRRASTPQRRHAPPSAAGSLRSPVAAQARFCC